MNINRRTRTEMSFNTTKRLLEVARIHFSKYGYAKVVMDDLCASAELTRGALHHHFGSKKGIFRAVVLTIFEEITYLLEKHYKQFRDPVQGYIETCVYYIDILSQEEMKQILVLDAPSVLGEELRKLEEQYYIQPLIDSLTEWQKSHHLTSFDPVIMAHLIDGAIANSSLWVFTQQDTKLATEQVKVTLRRFLNSLIHGLRIGT